MQNEDEKSLLVLNNSNKYGAIPKADTATPKKVIYCVHGKPSAGCCKVLQSEVIDIQPDDYVNPPTKENQDATELINRHCHRGKSPEIDRKARRQLIVASILCVVFMLGEVVGGYLSNSLAIASDAAHLLTDFASFMISLFSLWMATRPSTKKMHFGWYRAEVIGALTSVLLIWVVTGILVYMAVQRCINKTFDIDAKIMLITSGVGVVVNLIMGLTLHQHGHTHGGSSHSHDNINVRAAFIHVIGDFLQSFGVFVAAAIIYFRKDWIIIDPICTFIFSVLVMFTTFAIIRDTLTVLMEGAPKGIDFNEVMKILLTINGVKRVHNLRIWALSLDKIAMSAHIAISPEVNPQNILMVATKNIHDKYNFFEMTLQIEEFQEAMEDCTQCKNPI
ncbi:Cation efflux domain containing protein [Asbolus verrucosus]|uniref:Cation efflux domain containing protein n=1 Tax=Asbolus verrucosus TaxID=1661398 RepID=A0A482VYL9_ASBVE|nr:Cation efflux domain containing protein [Asbolus verrucosus]